jgi:hypothetical protein
MPLPRQHSTDLTCQHSLLAASVPGPKAVVSVHIYQTCRYGLHHSQHCGVDVGGSAYCGTLHNVWLLGSTVSGAQLLANQDSKRVLLR